MRHRTAAQIARARGHQRRDARDEPPTRSCSPDRAVGWRDACSRLLAMDPARKRQLMVERHIRARGIRDPRVLAAIGAVPREAFLPPELEEFAYEDRPLPIEAG